MKKTVIALILAILMIINTVPAFADSGDITIQQIIPALENWASQINDGENRSFTTVSSIGLSPYSGVPLFTATASGFEVSKVYIDSGTSLAFAFYNNYPYFGTHVVDSRSQVQARLRGNRDNSAACIKFLLNNKTVTYAFMDNLVFTPDSYGYLELVEFLSLYSPEPLITTTLGMTCPAGYALIIDKGNAGTFNGFFAWTDMLRSSFLQASNWNNGVQYWTSSDLNYLDSEYSVFTNNINWEKAENSTDSLGISKRGAIDLYDRPFLRYFCLINPVSYPHAGAVGVTMDKNNEVHFAPRGSYRAAFLIPLKQEYDKIYLDLYSERYVTSVVVDEVSGEARFVGWTTVDDLDESIADTPADDTYKPTVTPIVGGSSPQDDNIQIDSGGVFSNGTQGLKDLSSNANGFFRFMRSIFDWLPSQVTAVLISAMLVMIAVGVVKIIL